MHNSGASRRENAEARLKAWLFEFLVLFRFNHCAVRLVSVTTWAAEHQNKSSVAKGTGVPNMRASTAYFAGACGAPIRTGVA
jgi:hypothetical protein